MGIFGSHFRYDFGQILAESMHCLNEIVEIKQFFEVSIFNEFFLSFKFKWE